MEKKVINFSKGFIPSAVISFCIIVFGVAGFFIKGINFGIDFQPGLIEEVRIAPAAASIVYSGTAKVTVDVSSSAFDFIITGTATDNKTISYPYTQYPTVKSIADEANSIAGVKMILNTDGMEDTSSLFLNSAVTTQLGSSPLFIYAKNADVNIEDVRQALTGDESVSVKLLGEGNSASYQIRVAAPDGSSGNAIQKSISDKLFAAFGADNVAVVKTDFIGSSFSKNLAQKSLILMFLTFVLIWVYAAIRFHWDFALGSVIALVHDSLIMFTFIIWTGMEFSTTVLAAVLTIVGYSINATVVILDRVRENLKLMKVGKFSELLNASLTDTLSRSIITTITTLLAVISLYIFTSGSIKDFALALGVGLLSGAYSSIFISSGFITLFRIGWKQEYGIHHSERTARGVLQMNSGVSV